MKITGRYALWGLKISMSLHSIKSDFQKIIERLSTDWEFLQDFVSHPHAIISQFSLTEEQKNTLIARDANDLMRLGLHKAPPCGIKEELW